MKNRIITCIFCFVLSGFVYAQDRTFQLTKGIPNTTFTVRAEIGVWYKTCANSNHAGKLTKPYFVCEGFII